MGVSNQTAAGLIGIAVVCTAVLVGRHSVEPQAFVTLSAMVVSGALGAFNPQKKDPS